MSAAAATDAPALRLDEGAMTAAERRARSAKIAEEDTSLALADRPGPDTLAAHDKAAAELAAAERAVEAIRRGRVEVRRAQQRAEEARADEEQRAKGVRFAELLAQLTPEQLAADLAPVAEELGGLLEQAAAVAPKITELLARRNARVALAQEVGREIDAVSHMSPTHPTYRALFDDPWQMAQILLSRALLAHCQAKGISGPMVIRLLSPAVDPATLPSFLRNL